MEGTNQVLLYYLNEETTCIKTISGNYVIPFQHVTIIRNNEDIYILGGENMAGKYVGEFMFFDQNKFEFKAE